MKMKINMRMKMKMKIKLKMKNASAALKGLFFSYCFPPFLVLARRGANRNVQSLVEQGQKGELTMQPGKSMMESLESSINKVRVFK